MAPGQARSKTQEREVLMSLKGFSVPLSPEGRASLTPTPPWHYAGDILAIDFAADPAAVAAVLPPGLEPDPQDPGGCVAFFVAWQYASEGGQEYLDPARSQYNELLLLVNATYRGGSGAGGATGAGRAASAAEAPSLAAGTAVHTCPYIYVDKDTSMARGWIQGWPKKFGEVHTTRAFPLPSKAAPRLEPGGRFGGTLAANGRRLAEAVVELEAVSDDPVYLGKRPVVNMRYFPQLAGGGKARPPVYELVRSVMSGVRRTEIWEGAATLGFFAAPDNELDALQPLEVRRGYRYSMTMTIEDLEVLEAL
jgi:acetoacetate decarboxylase